MKAAYLHRNSGPEGLVLGELPQPTPGENEVLVRVHATGITPTEFQWFPTFNTPSGEPRPFPIILSHEFSGVIAGVGSRVTDLRIGDSVFGMNDWFTNGAEAEYCVAPAAAIALKPPALNHTQAAVVPISALTAWQGLFDRGGLKSGERVLIHGGSGGVGVFAVQLAHWRGAHVIATASARHLDFVREIGADEVIDYQTTRFEDLARDVDVVFDSIGGETLERSWSVLKPGGRVVTIAAQSKSSADSRSRAAFFIVEPSRMQLSEIANLLGAGTLRPFVAAVFPLDEAGAAYARALHGHMRGKIALQVALS